jgi:thiol-disulfide isomerase/thioredoxin
MKKLSLILCAVLMVLVGCKTKDPNQYTVNGLLDDAAFEGVMVYALDFADNSIALDSAVITNGAFSFTNTTSQPKLVRLRAEGEDKSYDLFVVLEPGTIHADMVTDSLSGTPLNDELYQFNSYDKSIGDPLMAEYAMINEMTDTAAQSAAMEEFVAHYDAAMEEYLKAVNQYYDRNKGNILGVYFISNMGELTLDEFNKVLEGAAPEVVNHPMVQQKLSKLQKLEQTKAGNPYVDIDVIDFQTGATAKLSDYIAGKVALVDFWASWCRPCRGEIPNIANIYKKYGKKMVVISLNVWDKPEAQAAAIQELNMNWIQLSDTTKNATEAYGVNGIPQIMLIGADGTILARDLREDAIEAAVIDALK